MNPNNPIGPLDPVDNRNATAAAASNPVLVGDLYAGRSNVNPGQPRTYSDKTYVVQPGQLNREDWLRWSNWMPSMDQLLAAARLNVADAVDPWERGAVTATMRQGIGMIVLLALIAGIIPFLANLWLGLTMQTAVPLAQAANSVTPLTTAYPPDSAITIIGTAVQTIAGLPPRMPGVLAGFLSALGMWINTPLYWLGIWIVYGLFVFGLARLMGASNTLQAFYAATAFIAVPLLTRASRNMNLPLTAVGASPIAPGSNTVASPRRSHSPSTFFPSVTSTRSAAPGFTNRPYFSARTFPSTSGIRSPRPSSRDSTSLRPACTIASSIITPGRTGNVAK